MFKRAQRLWTISFGSQFLSYWLSKLIEIWAYELFKF